MFATLATRPNKWGQPALGPTMLVEVGREADAVFVGRGMGRLLSALLVRLNGRMLGRAASNLARRQSAIV